MGFSKFLIHSQGFSGNGQSSGIKSIGIVETSGVAKMFKCFVRTVQLREYIT